MICEIISILAGTCVPSAGVLVHEPKSAYIYQQKSEEIKLSIPFHQKYLSVTKTETIYKQVKLLIFKIVST